MFVCLAVVVFFGAIWVSLPFASLMQIVSDYVAVSCNTFWLAPGPCCYAALDGEAHAVFMSIASWLLAQWSHVLFVIF